LQHPISAVLHAAEQQLARQTMNTQGTVYHLTPGNALIDFIEWLGSGVLGHPLDETFPGLLAVYRAGVSACGESTTQASWAIHYSVRVSVIAGAGGWRFFVKTRRGWLFWGNWCGADKSLKWRNTYC